MKRLCRGLIVGTLATVLLASSAKAGTNSPILGTVTVSNVTSISDTKKQDTLIMKLSWEGVGESEESVTLTGLTGLYTFTYSEFKSPAVGSDHPEWIEADTLDTVGFCIEPQLATSVSTLYDIRYLEDAPSPDGPGGDPMGEDKAELVRELWGGFHGYGEEGDWNRTDKAAFHLALLEIVFEELGTYGDGDYSGVGDSNNGKFYAQAMDRSWGTDNEGDGKDAITLANTWLGQLNGNGQKEANLVALSNDGYQDYIVHGHIAPEPSGLAMLVGLGGIGVLGTWRRRKRAV